METAFDRVIDLLPGLVWTALADGQADFVNRRWCEYTGLSFDQARGRGWQAAVHPDDRARLVEGWLGFIQSGCSGELEARLRRHDGEYRWFLFRVCPIPDASGEIVKWGGINTDIEDRKQAEKALRALERRARMIVDGLPAMITLMTPEGELGNANQYVLEFFGETIEVLKSRPVGFSFHPDDRAEGLARWRHSVQTGHPYDHEARLRRADGVYRWFHTIGFPLRDDDGRILVWYLLQTDIDDRRQSEDKLRRSEAFLAEAQRVSATGSFSWIFATNEIVWSEQIYRMFGLDPDEPVSLERIASRVHPDDVPLFEDMIARARRHESGLEYEHRLVMPDGSIKHLHLIAHGVPDQHGQMEYIGAVQDVTDRRHSEEALGALRSEIAHMARITSLGALTASIAHEVNQPLSGIITNANTCLKMLAADPPNVAGAQETARRTVRDGNRAADVISRLRALFGKKDIALEPVDLNEAVREVIALAWSDLQRGRVVVRSELAWDLPQIMGDRVQLQQVILNLLLNAADAMKDVEDRSRRVLIRTRPEDGDCVGLCVQDVGVGFDAKAAEKLFEAFYTSKGDGMGIGLSVSRSIIENHGGRLWATLNEGPGATFSFCIPVRPGDGPGAPGPGADGAMAANAPPRLGAGS
ncbi:MAG TPA: PAS domain-containing protein [Caulobacteraceae bacterium]|nr:PAS domain-containing protein [Caulobacteraceae bacterium]